MTQSIPKVKVWFITLLLCLAGNFTYAVTVFDDEGNSVTLSQPANRIISLAPSLTEILFAAGAGNKIVGVVEYSDYPTQALEIAIVGRHDLLDMETILSLQPDLIVAWKTGNPRASLDRLKEFGIPVYIAEPKQLQSIPLHIAKLGELAGTVEMATEVINNFSAELDQLEANYATRNQVSVFYQIWDTPLITAGGNELINYIISLCGGRNIFSELTLMSPKVSKESVLARNPQVIIASGMDIARPEWLDSWQEWPTLDAVANSHLYFIPPDLVQRHTPRVLQGARLMCEQIDRARP